MKAALKKWQMIRNFLTAETKSQRSTSFKTAERSCQGPEMVVMQRFSDE
jgi:hypothetical protein